MKQEDQEQQQDQHTEDPPKPAKRHHNQQQQQNRQQGGLNLPPDAQMHQQNARPMLDGSHDGHDQAEKTKDETAEKGEDMLHDRNVIAAFGASIVPRASPRYEIHPEDGLNPSACRHQIRRAPQTEGAIVPDTSPSFLFVCTGNICRSPLAEAAMRAEAEQRGLDLDIDSAGTGRWHLGDPPDHRARATARRHGLNIDTLSARQVDRSDFTRFTHILALDTSHLRELHRLAPPDAADRITLLLDHLPGREGHDVDDPYYEHASAFETTWEDVSEACRELARKTLDTLP